jgi:hypothetical protein
MASTARRWTFTRRDRADRPFHLRRRLRETCCDVVAPLYVGCVKDPGRRLSASGSLLVLGLGGDDELLELPKVEGVGHREEPGAVRVEVVAGSTH